MIDSVVLMSTANTVPARALVVTRRLRVVGSTLVLAVLFASACSGPGRASADEITVEGRVTYYGNVPFEKAALVTDDGNWYVLDMSDEQRSALVTPSRQRVHGRVYLGDWDGKPFARLDVHAMKRVDR